MAALRTPLAFCLHFTLSLFFILAFYPLFHPAHAADPSKQLSVIEKKLEKRKQQVKETIEKEKSILSEVENINRSVKQKQKEMRDYESRIFQTQANIRNLEGEIVQLSGKMEQRSQELKERLKVLYKQQYGGKALILINARDYQDLLIRSRYMSLLTYQDRKLIDAFNNELKLANEKKRDLEIMRTNLEISKENIRQKQKEMQSELDRKDKLLASVRSKRSSYERMIRELEESSERVKEMIEKIEKEKRVERFVGKEFSSQKGRLPWPVNGEVVIPFGKYNDPQYNIAVFKNGIEIKADRGEEPKSVSDGSVVYADWFKGYGLLLIIDHGKGYHTLYGHLSEIFHKSGDIIKKGTVVGKIGESGIMNVPALYFEIRYKGKPVDPLRWLKKNSR
ncbi:MAG: hypothetical protein C4538_12570 [Nitrospiraceae bacterium]|nr:MAG: hypothetical protein C4538_12570 [Nitrospiraceae bacterium]